jgi:Domain of Unknown Function (DUF928)
MNHGGRTKTGLFSALIVSTLLASAPSVAQNAATAAAQNEAPPSESAYKPPSRGVPGGRLVGAASRGTSFTNSLPMIYPLAPDGHAGQTTSSTPTLYFFVSQPITWPTQFTISAATRPKPIIEVDIPSPRAAGIYSVRTADYRVRLEPGVLYTWSVSAKLDPKSRSRDIVASASLLRTAPDPGLEAALGTAPLSRRVALLAQAGLWYDAVAAAAETAAYDRHAALDSLMTQVGLIEPARYDRETAAGIIPSR